MTTTDMRAEFEAWGLGFFNYGFKVERDEYGDYLHDPTDTAWEAWQAAYAAGRNAKREPLSGNCPKCGVARPLQSFGPACMQQGCPVTIVSAHGIGADHKEDAA